MPTPGMQKESHLAEGEKLIPTVLAVDDEPICLSILARLLEAQGVTVDTAQDGEQALLMWKEKQYPLIITDCNMPKMNGYSLAKAIRRLEQADHINKSIIVALSSNDKKEESQLCIDAGMSHVLTKPTNSAQIETLLSSWKEAFPESEHHSNLFPANIQNDKTPVDYVVLAEIFPDSSKHTRILKKLQAHIQADYETLELEIELANFLEIERLAHRMKGACKMVGANGIASACEEIETKAKKGLITQDIFISTLALRISEFDAHMNQQAQSSSNNSTEANNAST